MKARFDNVLAQLSEEQQAQVFEWLQTLGYTETIRKIAAQSLLRPISDSLFRTGPRNPHLNSRQQQLWGNKVKSWRKVVTPREAL